MKSHTEHSILLEENHRLQGLLDESQKALQELAYTVSHDLGAPLRAVTGFSAILQQKYAEKLDEKGMTYLTFIAEGGNKAQQMLAGLLRYSRVQTQAKPPKVVDMRSVLDVVLCELDDKVYATGAKIDNGMMPTVWADEEQIRQLMFSVLDNALTYHRPNTAPQITIAAEEIGDYWRFTVTDNGVGISIENAERVFQVFKRLHSDTIYPGIGMGLPVARRIVERHGGAIAIKPAQDQGTSVWFTLPGHDTSVINLAQHKEGHRV